MIGTIEIPSFFKYKNLAGGGLALFLTNIIRFLIIIAGIWALLNIILAGYQFISGGNDSKAISGAWAKIYQSILGLMIIAASVMLTSVISLVIFGDPSYILSIVVYGPV